MNIFPVIKSPGSTVVATALKSSNLRPDFSMATLTTLSILSLCKL